jgi:large subunit ribosomal protein L5
MDLLRTKYEKEIVPHLIKKFNYKNKMQAPKVTKVVINMGLGKEVMVDAKVVDHAAKQLAAIAGQRPVITTARKSIATYKLRKGMKIGAAVTLRKERMYSFLNRLFNVALPRVKDFKGLLKRGMDGRGNYSMGLKEQLIFPEIEYDSIDKIRGMNITIVTTAKNDEEAIELLAQMGMPFKN